MASLKIQVLGKGLIPRGLGLAPRKELFPADLTLISTILATNGLTVNFLNPESNKLEDLNRKNVRQMWDKYSNMDVVPVKNETPDPGNPDEDDEEPDKDPDQDPESTKEPEASVPEPDKEPAAPVTPDENNDDGPEPDPVDPDENSSAEDIESESNGDDEPTPAPVSDTTDEELPVEEKPAESTNDSGTLKPVMSGNNNGAKTYANKKGGKK